MNKEESVILLLAIIACAYSRSAVGLVVVIAVIGILMLTPRR